MDNSHTMTCDVYNRLKMHNCVIRIVETPKPNLKTVNNTVRHTYIYICSPNITFDRWQTLIGSIVIHKLNSSLLKIIKNL